MKFIFRQGEEHVETIENRGTKIKEIPQSTIVSFAIL
jgi:hypothetical protein